MHISSWAKPDTKKLDINILAAPSVSDISLLNIKRLQFNGLKHDSVPRHIKLTEIEKEEYKKKYNILSDNQIADISYFDPISLLSGFRPGDIILIKRKSRTAIESDFYRMCKI